MTLLFAVALFLSAALLFWVQPLIAKMLLPLLGGTPAVWNACMLFFQGTLLAGYAYALVLTRKLRPARQAALHLSVLVVAAFFLPVALSERFSRGAPEDADPVFWLLGALVSTLGLPFFALSSTAPLLQKWFSETEHERARDPYFLYAASNAGSLIALVAFPLLLEPQLRLSEQGRFWAALYVALVALTAACAVALLRARAPKKSEKETKEELSSAEILKTEAPPRASGPDALRKFRWAFLAFVPSSLVLGVTTYVTTDVAAVPLLWVVPLALYLLTYILAFARGGSAPRPLTDRVMLGASLILALVYLSGATEPSWFLIIVHLSFFFLAAYVCHKRLAADRPSTEHLAEFYLWLAVGGAAGGAFNAIVAPLAFDRLAEYPLAIVLACLALVPFKRSRETPTDDASKKLDAVENMRVPKREFAFIDGDALEEKLEEKYGRRARLLDFALPALLGLAVALLTLLAAQLDAAETERLALAVGLPLIVVNFFAKRPLRFALALGALMLANALASEESARTHFERNFYGALRVSEDLTDSTRRLRHGSTLHGRQHTDAARQCQPLSYYHRRGPLGSVFKAFDAKPAITAATAGRVAVVGLGTGASVAYSRPGQSWTFYEINPSVVRLASDARSFTYLENCAQADVRIVQGDARLKMRDAHDGGFDLIVLDAFSSDAVPAHLLTREALDLYLSKLAEGGWIVFHVSNRTLDLHAVVAGVTEDAGMDALFFDDFNREEEQGREPSQWVAAARRREDLTTLRGDPRWQPLLSEDSRRREIWRDDFSNILKVFKWN